MQDFAEGNYKPQHNKEIQENCQKDETDALNMNINEKQKNNKVNKRETARK